MKKLLFLTLLCGCEKAPDPNAPPQIGRIYLNIHSKHFRVIPLYYEASRRFIQYTNLDNPWMPRAWMPLTNLNQDFRLKK